MFGNRKITSDGCEWVKVGGQYWLKGSRYEQLARQNRREIIIAALFFPVGMLVFLLLGLIAIWVQQHLGS